MDTITSLSWLLRSTSVRVLAALAMMTSWNLMAHDPSTVGVYHGLVSRTAEPPAWTNSHLGAQLEINALANGTYTGKLTSLGTPLSFSGSILSTDIGVGTSTATISRGSLPALTVELSFADDQVSGTVSHPDGSSATLSGWRNVWNAATRPATDYLGRHHFLVTSELGSAGTGYGTFTVPANGSITVNGKLPDGSAFKTTTFVGPQGQVLIYQPLYTVPGSLIGTLIVAPGADGASATLSATSMSWFKAPQTAPSDRFYKEGFLVGCDAAGGLYKVPAVGDIAAGLPDVVNNGMVSFAGLVESSETIPDSSFTLTSAAKLTMPTGSVLNPAKTTLTVNPTTGLFSGGFTLVDQDLNTQIGTDVDGNAIYKKVTRAVKYEGLIVDDGITVTAGGFYLAPNLPDTSAEPPTLLTTSIIEGGVVSIAPNPDAPPPLLISFDTATFSQAEGVDGEVSIITAEPLEEALTITVNVVPGTAVAADLSATSISVTLYAGSTGQTIRVPVKDDGLDEEDENFQLVIADGAGFDLGQGALDVTIEDDDYHIEIADDPRSQIIELGGEDDFRAIAAGSDQTYQWQRNNVNLAGATSEALKLTNVQLAHAGTYRVVISNLINTETSGNAELAVVDTSTRLLALTPGATATMSAITAAPPGSLRYQWFLSGTMVEDDTGPNPRVTGATTATLTIRNVSDTDIGDYGCRIVLISGEEEITAGGHFLRLPTVKPDLLDLELPDGQILKAYSYQVLFDEGIDSAPGSFSATGLPAGLGINANTGVISGTPTTPVTNVRVVITATNPLGSTSVEDFINILPFPAGALGAFHGIVDRVNNSIPWDRADLGARIEILTTATGGFSGKLLNGTTLPFSGQLGFDGDLLMGRILVKQLNKFLPPLHLVLSFDTTEQTFAGSLRDFEATPPDEEPPPSGSLAAVWGWRNAWTKTAPATAYLGRFNFALDASQGDSPDAPEGAGFGSFVVPASGTFNISGLMPDGTAFICNTFLGPDGQLALYQPLFKNPGSVHGAIQVKLATEEDTGGPLPPGIDPPSPTVIVAQGTATNPVGIVCSWNKPFQYNDRASKLYRYGFSVTSLAVRGGLYTPPESGAVVMDLPEVHLNAELEFSSSAEGTEFPSQYLTITPAAKAVLPNGEENPMKVAFTVNATTGLFNGTFTKLDEDPNRPPLFDDNTGRLIRAQGYFSRNARYSGIILPRTSLDGGLESIGRGFFTIPELPNPDFGITAANAQTLAGNLSLRSNRGAADPITIGFTEESLSLSESEPARQISVSLSEPLTTRRTVAISIQHRTTSAADFTLSSTSVVFEPGQTEASFTLTITPDNLDEQDEVFYLKLADGVGYDILFGRMVCTIADDDEAVQISSSPLHQLVTTGNPFSLGIELTGTPPIAFQWRRDSVDIPGAITSNYDVGASKVSDGGKYDVVISNRVGSITSPIANVAVMDSAEKFSPAMAGANVSLALNINAPAGAVTYQWARVAPSSLVTDNTRITGSSTKTLKINNISENDEGEYFCEVTLVSNLPGPARSLSSPYHWIVIVNEAPELFNLTPLNGAVSKAFTQQVEFQPGSNRRPASFSATNLPAGLTIDTASGLISGTPTVAVTDRSITITATNAIGSDSITTTITTTPLPVEIIGTFHGYVERNVGLPITEGSLEYQAPWPEAELGALFEMTTAATGSFTGKLTYAGTANSFTGAIVDVTGILFAKALIQRTGKPALFFECVLDSSMPEHNGMVSNTDPFSGNGTVVPMRFWKQVWSAAKPATAYAGNYSFGIIPNFDPGPRSPGGTGFATCTVPTNGAPFTIKGRLPDGTAFACSSLLGPAGQFVIYQALYTRLGSVLAPGQLTGDPDGPAGAPVSVEEVPRDGATLYKPVQTAAAETIYRNGIGPIFLRMIGGRVVVTPAGSIIMGLADTNDNASITFANTGSATPPDTIFRIRVGGATTMKTGIDFNPAKVAVTVKPASGEFSGSFTLTDSNPFNNAITLTRPASFQGAFIQLEGNIVGMGYFTLKQLPDPSAIPPQTVISAPSYTGFVQILPGPGSP